MKITTKTSKLISLILSATGLALIITSMIKHSDMIRDIALLFILAGALLSISNRKKTTLVILLFLLPLCINAQKKDSPDTKVYNVKLKCSDKTVVRGFLYMVMDSAVVVAKRYTKHPILDTISPNYIRKIKLTRRGNGSAGFAVGALTSIATGVIFAATETDPDPADKSQYQFGDIFSGIFFAIPVGIIGAVVGNNISNRYTINYSYDNFKLYKSELVKRAYHQSSLIAK